MAGLGDMVNKAKDWAGQNPDKADSYVDQAGDQAKQRFGHDEQVDQYSEKGKDYLHPAETSEAGQQPAPPQGAQPPGAEEPPPPPQ